MWVRAAKSLFSQVLRKICTWLAQARQTKSYPLWVAFCILRNNMCQYTDTIVISHLHFAGHFDKHGDLIEVHVAIDVGSFGIYGGYLCAVFLDGGEAA